MRSPARRWTSTSCPSRWASVPYEWSRTYPNDSYDFPPEYLKGAPFDALAKRIGQWFDVVGKKYDRIYLALPAHHSRLVKAALKGKPTKHITWVGQRQCLDQNVCADGEYRATTHSYRGFLKKNVRGAANRGHANQGDGRAATRAEPCPDDRPSSARHLKGVRHTYRPGELLHVSLDNPTPNLTAPCDALPPGARDGVCRRRPAHTPREFHHG